MKKTFKIGLTVEMVIIFLISFVLTMVIMAVGVNSLHFSRLIYPKNSNTTILKSYNEGLAKSIDMFIKENINELVIPNKLDGKLKEAFPLEFNNKLKFNEEIYIAFVNSNGKVVNSNTRLLIINSKDEIINSKVLINNIEGKDINPYKGELGNVLSFTPEDSLKVVYNSDQGTQIKEVRKVADDLFLLVVKNTIYTDTFLSLIAIVIFFIIFVLLIKGRLKYILSIEKDISQLYTSDFDGKIQLKYNNELTSLAAVINDMAKRIKENRKNEEEFLLNISHDLRTPLTSILGFVNLLKQKRFDSVEEQEKYLSIIEDKCIYLKKLSEEFFEFSKLKWNKTELIKQRINVQEMLRQLTDSYYTETINNKLTILMELSEKPIYVEVDIDKFMRVMENVMSNAIKYCSCKTEIIIKSYKNDDKLFIEFWNTPANSISKEELEFMFRRFYKGDASRNSEGAGLGLPIALEIIALHGGTIESVLEDNKLGIIITL